MKEFWLIERKLMEAGNTKRTYAVLASQRGAIEGIADFQGDSVDGRITVCDEEFTLPVLLFTCNLVDEFVDPKDFAGGINECRVRNVIYPFLHLKRGSAELELLYAGQVQPKGWHVSLLADLLIACQEFATQLGGLKILLHAPTASHLHETFRDEQGVFHIFVHTIPTGGVVRQHHPNTLLGISVETPAGFYANFEPIHGRGVSLGDEKGKVVQVIGNNIYLLFDPFQIMEAGQDIGMRVFKKALALTFDHILQRAADAVTENAEEDVNATAESVNELADAYTTYCLTAFERDLAIQKNKLREAEEHLVERQRQIRELQNLHAIITREDFYAGKLRTRLYEEHQRIVALPLVKRAYIVPETGYEVETETVHITHEGKVYAIGSYILRFASNGSFYVYTKTSHHPKDIPHPHICPWNGPCFGNVKRVIEESCAEYRYTDATAYIIDWLTTGYSPDLVVHHKIDEWPIATQHKEHAQ